MRTLASDFNAITTPCPDDAANPISQGTPQPTSPPDVGRVSGPRRSSYRRGVATGLMAMTMGLAACGGGSDSPTPAATPSPTPTPAPAPATPTPTPVPVPAPPTAPDPLPAGFVEDTTAPTIAGADPASRRYTKAGRTVVYNGATGLYYELVTPGAPAQWTVARDAAIAAGGTLATPSTAEALTFLKQAYVNGELPTGGTATGANGAWIGLQQTVAGAVAPGDNWTFTNVAATPLPASSLLWNTGEPNDSGNLVSGLPAEGGLENFGAIYYGATAATTDVRLIYDAGAGATITQTKYLIEYATKATIQ